MEQKFKNFYFIINIFYVLGFIIIVVGETIKGDISAGYAWFAGGVNIIAISLFIIIIANLKSKRTIIINVVLFSILLAFTMLVFILSRGDRGFGYTLMTLPAVQIYIAIMWKTGALALRLILKIYKKLKKSDEN